MSADLTRDRVAIVGVGSTGYSRGDTGRSAPSYAYEAAVAAIRDADLTQIDIDGVVSSTGSGYPNLVPPASIEVVAALGLPTVTYYSEGNPVIGGAMIDAINALLTGRCRNVLVYHYNYRGPYMSRRAASDPFRRWIRGYADDPPESAKNAAAYSFWASNYFARYDARREHLGYLAINSRTNAASNPLAAIREPLTMEEYLEARMIRDPLCMFDMDLPVDGADAFVLTLTERAADRPHTPVLVHTANQGAVGPNDEDQLPSLERHGHDVVVEQLWRDSERTLADVDVAFIYDGFTFIAMSWLEKLGWCGPGEAGSFIEQHWVDDQQRLMIDGRIPVNPSGGMLSEGGTQGAGSVREAVHQLRGDAGSRQVEQAETALLAIGGFFYNAQSIMLTRGPA